jgi:glycosyltransferase involved in cell wall biosynthesis
MNKKVLLFAAYFPPRRRVGSLRPFRFATQLKKNGWEVHVISIKDSGAELTKEETKALEGINQFEILPPFDHTASGKKGSKKSSKKKPLADFIDRNFPIDTWWPLFWKHRKEIEAYVTSVKPDIMWSTSDPWSVNHTAGKIAKQFGIPWVADFRDPWTLCSVRYGKRGWPLSAIDKKVEQNILRRADYVTFTAESTRTKYQSHFPFIQHKSSVLYNAFEVKEKTVRPDHLPDLSDDSLNILFLGAFRDLSKAESMLEVLIRFKQKYPEESDQIRVFSMGELTGSDLDKSRLHKLEHVFRRLDRVPHTQVPALVDYFDLNLLSTHPDRDDIIPAKLYDYLASENPIFSLAPNPEVGEIVRQTGSGLHFGPDETDAAADHLFHLVKLKKQGNLRAERGKVNTEALKPYTAEETTAQLELIFNQLLKDGQ